MDGWVKINRKLAEWQWHDEPGMLSVLMHIILYASYKETMYRGIEVKRGQWVTTMPKLAEITGLSYQNVRTCVDRLVESGCINRQTTNKFTVLTLCKYEYYQCMEDALIDVISQSNNEQITNKLEKERKEAKERIKKEEEGKNNNTHTHTKEKQEKESVAKPVAKSEADVRWEMLYREFDGFFADRFPSLKHMKRLTQGEFRELLGNKCKNNMKMFMGILGQMNNKPDGMRGRVSVFHTFESYHKNNKIEYL